MPDETAWLIERPNGFWWAGAYDSDFSPSHEAAIRFSRREDAERVIRGLMRHHPTPPIATEHIWAAPAEEGKNG